MSVREHSEGRSANCLSLYTIYELDKDKYIHLSVENCSSGFSVRRSSLVLI